VNTEYTTSLLQAVMAGSKDTKVLAALEAEADAMNKPASAQELKQRLADLVKDEATIKSGDKAPQFSLNGFVFYDIKDCFKF
jgi:DNA-binding response OmpR family regulator